MTFVRAQKFAAGVHLMTDWRVTDERSAHPPSFLTGTLKAWILSPRLCVAYAGNVSAAINRLREMQGPAANCEVTEVLMQLRSSSQRDGVEYALATAPDGQLFRIVNDHVEPVEQLWLGEPAAWQKYGDIFKQDTSEEPEGTLTLPPEVDHVSASGRNRMNAAFDKLIREGGVDSVGELAVGVRTDVSGFHYCTAAYVGGGYGQIHVPDGVPTLVDMGTPETGTFDWALLPCENAPAVALYFAGARFGAVFCPARFEAPVTAAGASMSEFIGRAYDLTTLRFEDGIEYSRQSVDES